MTHVNFYRNVCDIGEDPYHIVNPVKSTRSKEN